MASILLHRTLGSLHPVDDEGREIIAKFSAGEIIKAEISRPRNVKFLRKFFAMLQIILENQDHYKSMDDLLDVSKLSVGHVRVIQTKRGEVRIPKSISFAAMDETAFSEFYERVVTWVLAEVIPGLQRKDLDEEVANELRELVLPKGY